MEKIEYDYNKAKIILFLSTQYELGTVSADEITDLIKHCTDSGANGYVLMPFDENHYGFDKVFFDKDADENLDNMMNGMVNFTNELCKNDVNAHIWLGTPWLTSKNIGVFQSASNEVLLNLLKTFVKKMKAKLNLDIWDKNIIGFFYNQESIYAGTNGDAEKMLNAGDGYPYRQYKLINDFSFYIHNSIDCTKDLIWIPYLTTADTELSQAEVFKRIGTMINKTNCFDCVFIQPHLGALYGSEKYKNKKGESENDKLFMTGGKINTSSPKYTKEFIDEVKAGKGNVNAIRNSINDSIMYYRDGVIVNYNPKTYFGNCLIGAEYELNRYFYSDAEECLFTDYGKFDECVNKRPIMFYWQGKIEDAFNVIKEKFNPVSESDMRNYKNINWKNKNGDIIQTNRMGMDGGNGTTFIDTYTSDFKLKKGDDISFKLIFYVDPEHLDNVVYGGASDDFEFEINGYLVTIQANVECESGAVKVFYDGNESNDISIERRFVVDPDTDGSYLSVRGLLPCIRIEQNPLGAWFKYEVTINNNQVI